MIISRRLYSIQFLVFISVFCMVFGCTNTTTSEESLSSSIEGVTANESSESGSSSESNSSEFGTPDDPSSSSHGDTISSSSSSVSRSIDDESSEADYEAVASSVEENTAETKNKDSKSDYILGDDVELRTYNIIIDPDTLDKINATPQDEIYVMAHLVFEGDTIKDVQVRYKGGAGAWYPCTNDAETGSPWPPGPNQCAKLSTKVKFNNEWDPDRKFYGLKKLQFHHMHHYDSQLRDRLVYWVHRAMGNPAPRAVHARLEINGTLSGLYTLVEQIDGRFTRERWDDGEGNIYKNNAPLNEGELSDDVALMEVLKTNEDENPSFDQWQTFERELEAAEDTETIKEVIRKWWDVPQLVSTVITSMALMHWDSPFLRIEAVHHNSYWYSDTTEQKLYAIPWDADNANLSMSGFPGEYSKGHMGPDDIIPALQCNSPVSNKFMGHWVCFPDEVKTALDRLLDDVYPQIMPLVTQWKADIEEVTLEAYNTHGGDYPRGALTIEKWEKGVKQMKKALNDGKGHVENWRDAL